MENTPKTFKELFANTGIEPTTDENGNTHYHFNAIRKKEPKQETLEEAAENYAKDIGNKNGTAQFDFKKGTKWKQEKMYSEEEVEMIARDAYVMGRKNILIGVFNKWFEQFKNNLENK
jgi:hypothetical protein